MLGGYLSLIFAQVPLRMVLAVPPSDIRVRSTAIPSQEKLSFRERELFDLNEEFYGWRESQLIFLVSKRLPKLQRLAAHFDLTKVVLAQMINEPGCLGMIRVSGAKLSPKHQEVLAAVVKRGTGVDLAVGGVAKSDFPFSLDGRARFESPNGPVSTPDVFRRSQDVWDSMSARYQSTVWPWPILVQNDDVKYDRSSFPEDQSSSFRVTSSYDPASSVDGETLGRVGMIVDRVFNSLSKKCQAEVNSLVKRVATASPGAFDDLLESGAIGESLRERYLKSIKRDMMKNDVVAADAEEALKSVRFSRIEALISIQLMVKTVKTEKRASGPFQLNIWPVD